MVDVVLELVASMVFHFHFGKDAEFGPIDTSG